MKRSEKEAEVRKLLETPGAKMLLPELAYKFGDEYGSLVKHLVDAAMPAGGWEPENRTWKASPVVGPAGTSLVGAFYGPKRIHYLQHSEAQEIADAYNAMKEAKEAEANPNDPLTVALEKVAAEEIAGLVEDVAKVTQEVYTSKYTREEFVAAEFRYGVEGQGLPGVDFDELDPDVEEALRKRAEWNAQAAERAGIVWRHQSAKVACRNCGGYEWPEKISDYGECRKCVSERLEQEHARKVKVPDSANKAWAHYYDDPNTPNPGDEMPRFLFNAGFDYGYKSGWRARMDTLNPVCSPEAADETLAAEEESGPTLDDALAAIDEINRQFDNEIDMRRELAKRVDGLEDRADQHKASIATIAESQTRVESEWKIQGQKYTADLRRVSHVNGELAQRVTQLERENKVNSEQLCALSIATRESDEDLERRINGHMDKLARLEERITELEVRTQESARHLDGNLQELRDLGQKSIDRLDQQKATSAQLSRELTELGKATAINSNKHASEIIRLRQEMGNLEAGLQGLMDTIGKLSGRINRLEGEMRDKEGLP